MQLVSANNMITNISCSRSRLYVGQILPQDAGALIDQPSIWNSLRIHLIGAVDIDHDGLISQRRHYLHHLPLDAGDAQELHRPPNLIVQIHRITDKKSSPAHFK